MTLMRKQLDSMVTVTWVVSSLLLQCALCFQLLMVQMLYQGSTCFLGLGHQVLQCRKLFLASQHQRFKKFPEPPFGKDRACFTRVLPYLDGARGCLRVHCDDKHSQMQTRITLNSLPFIIDYEIFRQNSSTSSILYKLGCSHNHILGQSYLLERLCSTSNISTHHSQSYHGKQRIRFIIASIGQERTEGIDPANFPCFIFVENITASSFSKSIYHF